MIPAKPSNRRSRAGRLAAASAGLLALSVALPAAAQAPQCAARKAVLERLSSTYHEEPVSIGVTATGSLLEVLASPEGSWTIIITVPGGPTCLVSSGEGWRGAPVQIAEDPDV
jgi:hypothetical protein